MKIQIAIAIAIAKVAFANNLRGLKETPESRELQKYIYGTSKGKSWNDDDGDLILVKDDDSDYTRSCADYVAEEFGGDFNKVRIKDNDDDAQTGDIVAVVDEDTDCDELMEDLERELGNQRSETTVYVYYGKGNRYYGKSRGKKNNYRLWYGKNRSRGWRGRGYGGGKRYWHKKGKRSRYGGGWHKKKTYHHKYGGNKKKYESQGSGGHSDGHGHGGGSWHQDGQGGGTSNEGGGGGDR